MECFIYLKPKKELTTLLNVSGKLVGRGSTEALLDFSKLSTGVYFLELNGNDGSNQHHKIILKRRVSKLK